MSETIEKTGFKIETSAIRAYTMLGALILIWLFFHYATDSNTPDFWDDFSDHIRHFFSFRWIGEGIFLTPRNLSNLMLQMSVTGILAVGMLMVIVSGNIDLSVGSVLGLAGGTAALLLTSYEYGLVVSILAAIVVATVIGAFHGFLTAYFNIPAFIVTLGGLLAWRGAVKGITKSETVPIAEPTFKLIGQGNLDIVSGWIVAAAGIAFVMFLAYWQIRSQRVYGLEEPKENAKTSRIILLIAEVIIVIFWKFYPEILPMSVWILLVGSTLFIIITNLTKAILPVGIIILFIYVMNSSDGVPLPVLIFLVVALFGVFITNATTFGRYLYAIGGNSDAARLSGINTRLNVLKVFALLGLLTGIAAVIFTARQGSAGPDAGVLKELDAIAACVIGGASLMGGRGTIFGACLGALIMASLDNGMSLLNVRDFMQELIKGTILVAAVGLDMIGKKS